MGRTSTPGLVHGHEQERDALVLGDVGVGAGEHEDPVGQVAGAGPDLLAVDDPLVAVELGPAPEVAEVGAGVGLGVALAPQVLAGEDAGQEVRLLLVGPPLQDRVADHLDAEDVVVGSRPGTPALENSSARITCSSAVSPPPPYSAGHDAASSVVGGERGPPLVAERGRPPRPASAPMPCPPARAGARRGRPGPSRGTPRPRRSRWAPWRRGYRRAPGRSARRAVGAAQPMTVRRRPRWATAAAPTSGPSARGRRARCGSRRRSRAAAWRSISAWAAAKNGSPKPSATEPATTASRRSSRLATDATARPTSVPVRLDDVRPRRPWPARR